LPDHILGSRKLRFAQLPNSNGAKRLPYQFLGSRKLREAQLPNSNGAKRRC